MSEPYEIRMAHPGRNALGTELMDWLLVELDRACERPFLLTGTERAFSAGLNLKQLAGLGPGEIEPFLRKIDEVAARIWLHPAPTVALVNGHAIAGGCVLALACDHAVALDDAGIKVGLNEIALGVPFPPKVLGLCRRRIPARHHARVLLGAELVDPRTALELGLVAELGTEADARARLRARAALPRTAYALEKRVLFADAVAPTAEDERRFVEEELPLWLSEEVKGRVRAVLGG